MRKQINRITLTTRILLSALLIVASVGFPPPAMAQQQTMTQTTLANAVSGPALYSGTSPTISQFVCLASVTGISAPILPGTPVSVIYVDREAMGVFSVNTSTACLVVNRGYLGTQASPHVSGQMVLVAPLYQTTLGTGANPVPNGLFTQDPPLGAACTPAGTTTTPWVNVLTGAQWLCSSATSTWVAGWNNPYATDWTGPTATVASAAGAITPSGPYFTITGAAAVTGFNVATGGMIGFDSTAVGYGCFNIRSATGTTATWTNAGNISVAGTFTANKLFTFCWDPLTLKFVPSTVA
jgi:hypothetical protein